MKNNILYITYDGLLEPLGQSQVLSYLQKLKTDYQINIISFEKKNDKRTSEYLKLKKSLAIDGINWIPLTYHKRFSVIATFYDIISAVLIGLWIIIRYKIVLIHGRSYVAGLTAQLLKQLTRVPVLFDIRGFWIDERIERGIWRKDLFLIPLFRRVELFLYKNANVINTLTYKSIPKINDKLNKKVPITVIPTCADLNRFIPSVREKECLTIGYSGSIDTAYLFEPVLSWVHAIAKENNKVKFLVLTKSPREKVITKLTSLINAGVEVVIKNVSHSDMHIWIKEMDVSIYFIKTGISSLASCPTKMAELLGCGVPIITNKGVGDIADILEPNKIGIIVDPLSEPTRIDINRIMLIIKDNSTSSRCREIAQNRFSLESGARAYKQIYQEMIH